MKLEEMRSDVFFSMPTKIHSQSALLAIQPFHYAGLPLFLSAPVAVLNSSFKLLLACDPAAPLTSGISNTSLLSPSTPIQTPLSSVLLQINPPTHGWILYRKCKVQFCSPPIFAHGVVIWYFGRWLGSLRMPGSAPSGKACLTGFEVEALFVLLFFAERTLRSAVVLDDLGVGWM